MVKIIDSGIMKSLQLLKELRKVSLSFGVISVIILGARIMVLLSFILLLKKISMAF